MLQLFSMLHESPRSESDSFHTRTVKCKSQKCVFLHFVRNSETSIEEPVLLYTLQKVGHHSWDEFTNCLVYDCTKFIFCFSCYSRINNQSHIVRSNPHHLLISKRRYREPTANKCYLCQFPDIKGNENIESKLFNFVLLKETQRLLLFL